MSQPTAPGAAPPKGTPGGEGPSGWRSLLPDRATLARVALAFLIGSIGAVVFYWIRFPLPIFLGALTFCLIASVLDAPLARPTALSIPMRTVLGVTIGSAFTPALMGRIPDMAASLAFVLPYTVLLVLLGIWFFERFARFDRPTAFFASVPGGLTDMVSLAAESGANQRAVTLIHATRIVMIVFLVPAWLAWHDGIAAGGRIANVIHIWEMRPLDAVMLIALAWAGYRLAARIGLAGAPLVGPMLLSGIVHAAGLTTAKVPSEVLILAQVTLGVLLGCQFRGLTWREVSNYLVWGVAFSAVLVLLTIVVTLGIARLTGLPSVSIMLAFAPGGQNELNLLALVLGLDVAFVALHHLVRLAVVFAGVQIVLKTTPALRQPPRPPD